ncbi:MAG TPA: metalloregulator ArsR/SmtB family transcription factor [Actinopolymorphaceae bacterium]|nr:metalloregulator ArsR/SmtB family transcription factor [Actinopolymorphaceae bacterium]
METYESAALDALGDPTRRAIFERLGRGPSAVGELARDLPVSRPAVSQHLKVLKAAGLVVDQAVGTRRVYRLNPEGVAGMQAYFQRFWAHALTAFKAAAEHPHPPAQQHTEQQDQRQEHGTTKEERPT